MWDPEQYLRYAEKRARPFKDLLDQVPLQDPATVVDLGCGPGGLTESLLERFPDARIHGIDSSSEMINRAARRSVPGRLSFAVGDLCRWQAAQPVDLVVANACLHWVADHRSVLTHLLRQLRPQGVLAFQVPNSFQEPSHRLLDELLARPPWADLVSARQRAGVETAAWYLERLAGRCRRVNLWETVYYQVLDGQDAVLEWMRGTTLRPVLALLDADQQTELLAAYCDLLAAAYPPADYGTVFPFRRLFVVATV